MKASEIAIGAYNVDDISGRLEIVAHDLVLNFQDPRSCRGSAIDFAPLYAMQSGALLNKVKPIMDDCRLMLQKSIPVQLAAGDFQTSYVFSQAAGHRTCRTPDASKLGDVAPFNQYADFYVKIDVESYLLRGILKNSRIVAKENFGARLVFGDLVHAGFDVNARLAESQQ